MLSTTAIPIYNNRDREKLKEHKRLKQSYPVMGKSAHIDQSFWTYLLGHADPQSRWASSGIGRETTLKFAQGGAKVVGRDRGCRRTGNTRCPSYASI